MAANVLRKQAIDQLDIAFRIAYKYFHLKHKFTRVSVFVVVVVVAAAAAVGGGGGDDDDDDDDDDVVVVVMVVAVVVIVVDDDVVVVVLHMIYFDLLSKDAGINNHVSLLLK